MKVLRLLEEMKDFYIQKAVEEINELIRSGANVDTQHERKYLINYFSQKYGISPEDIEKQIKISRSTFEVDDNYLKKAWQLTLDRLPKKISDVVSELELQIEDESPDYEYLDAETNDDNSKIILYRKGLEKHDARMSTTLQLLAHEAWHIYAAKTDFYNKLQDALENQINSWMEIGVKDIDSFTKFLWLVENTDVAPDFARRLNQKIIQRKWWGEQYFLDASEEDKLKGILKEIKSPLFLGALEELMAEAMGRIVSGKSLFVPGGVMSFMLRVI